MVLLKIFLQEILVTNLYVICDKNSRKFKYQTRLLTHVTFCLNVVIPIVKFANGIERPVKAEKWVIRTGNGGQVTRTQLPLQLAWAISIHKSQVIQFQLLILSKYPSVFVTTLTLIFDLLKTVEVDLK